MHDLSVELQSLHWQKIRQMYDSYTPAFTILAFTSYTRLKKYNIFCVPLLQLVA